MYCSLLFFLGWVAKSGKPRIARSLKQDNSSLLDSVREKLPEITSSDLECLPEDAKATGIFLILSGYVLLLFLWDN